MRERLTTAADIVAALLVSAGAAAMYWPAGLVVAGACVAAMSWQASR